VTVRAADVALLEFTPQQFDTSAFRDERGNLVDFAATNVIELQDG
jgi:hypothetical protein